MKIARSRLTVLVLLFSFACGMMPVPGEDTSPLEKSDQHSAWSLFAAGQGTLGMISSSKRGSTPSADGLFSLFLFPVLPHSLVYSGTWVANGSVANLVVPAVPLHIRYQVLRL